jgi:chloramphenicol 3-O-phosphotransferase
MKNIRWLIVVISVMAAGYALQASSDIPTDVPPGTVVVLNGTTRAGKTSIVKHLATGLGPSYQLVAIDDFHTQVFQDKKKLKFSEDEFLARIAQANKAMYDRARVLALEGKNVIVDTILSGHEGETEVRRTLEELRGLNVFMVLAYCPLPALAEQIKKCNAAAQLNNNLCNIRSRSIALRLDDIYRVRKSHDDVVLGVLSPKDVEVAYDAAQREWYEDAAAFAQVKSNLLSRFGLNRLDIVEVVPHLNYDCIVDTSQHSSEQCSNQICEMLKTSDMSEFEKNCKRLKIDKEKLRWQT